MVFLLFAGEYPWMVAIIKEEPSLQDVLNVYQCGGSLIHPSVILTAGKDTFYRIALLISHFFSDKNSVWRSIDQSNKLISNKPQNL